MLQFAWLSDVLRMRWRPGEDPATPIIPIERDSSLSQVRRFTGSDEFAIDVVDTARSAHPAMCLSRPLKGRAASWGVSDRALVGTRGVVNGVSGIVELLRFALHQMRPVLKTPK